MLNKKKIIIVIILILIFKISISFITALNNNDIVLFQNGKIIDYKDEFNLKKYLSYNIKAFLASLNDNEILIESDNDVIYGLTANIKYKIKKNDTNKEYYLVINEKRYSINEEERK